MVLRKIARPLLASPFLTDGIASLNGNSRHQETAAAVSDLLSEPVDADLLDQAIGGVKVVAAGALAIGKLPRFASLALIISLLPETALENRFWEMPEGEERDRAKATFYKNLGLMGALVLASLDTAGKPGLVWRSKNAGHVAQLQAQLKATEAKLAAKKAVGRA